MGKRLVLLILVIAIISIVGCRILVEWEQVKIKTENKLIVQKLTETEGQYEQSKKITDKEKVDIVYKIFKNAIWRGTNDKSTYPDIRINNDYAIWILTPDNRIKVKIESMDKNTFLSKKDSKTLYQIITDEKLRE